MRRGNDQALRRVIIRKRSHHILLRLTQRPAIRQQPRPLIRQGHRPRRAIQQPAPQLLFKTFQRLTDRGFSQPDLIRSAGNALCFRNSKKHQKIVQIWGHSLAVLHDDFEQSRLNEDNQSRTKGAIQPLVKEQK